MEESLLAAECLLYPENRSATVTLSTSSITIRHSKSKTDVDEVVSIRDLTGCQLVRGNPTTGAQWYLCLFFYPLKKKRVKGLTRQRMVRSFAIVTCDDDDAKEVMEKWIKAIHHLIAGGNLSADQVCSLRDRPRRNLIVYVNPFSGRGKAMQIYENHVKPMFAEAEIKHQVIKTEYAGQAKEQVKELALGECDGIIIVSGDGLVHEVLNGLMERSDWERAIQTPIGIVPGGSGNALAASLVYASTGVVRSNNIIEDSLFEIIRGRTRDLSLVYAEAGDRRLYSFLSFGWGFTADVDIESEKYRGLGDARFTVGCVVRVASLRKYHGMISYLPVDEHRPKNPSDGDLWPMERRSASMNDSGSPSILTASASNDVVGLSFKLKDPTSEASCGGAGDPTAPVITHEEAPPADQLTRPFHLQAQLPTPLPPGWKTLEDEFVWVNPVYLSHLGEDMFMMPCAKLGGDVMYLYCLKSTVSKMDLLQLLLSIEKGTHLDMCPNDTVLLPCRAFRLEPFVSHTGYMTVDGELIPHGPLQASVTNVKAKLLCSVPPP